MGTFPLICHMTSNYSLSLCCLVCKMGAVIVPPYKVTYCKDTELKYAKLLECCPAYGKYPIKLVYYIERDCWGTLVDLQQGLRKREGHLTTPNIHSDKNSTLSKNGWTLPQCG